MLREDLVHARLTVVAVALAVVTGMAVTAAAQEVEPVVVELEPPMSLGASIANIDWLSGMEASGGSSPSKAGAVAPGGSDHGIEWKGVLSQSLLYLTVQHLARMHNDRTRRNLTGPFVNDWMNSIHSLDGFNDGGKILTNWVAHPMMGSISAFILGQNDPEYVAAKVGHQGYWRTKGKQFLYATAYSAQFELGPLSESSIGNVQQGAIDLVLTPTLGTLWSVGEDLTAQHILKPLRRNHPTGANTLTIFLNPTRSFANVMALKKPWACDVASCR